MLHHEALQHLDGNLTNLPELLQSCAGFPEQQSNQEVILTEVIRQRVIQLEVCEDKWDDKETRTDRLKK